MMECYHTNKIIVANGGNADVLKAVDACFLQERNNNNVIDYVAQWRNLTWYQQCLAVFDSLIDNVVYSADSFNQYVKTPARLLYDGVGDCKSFTIYLASCLWALGADEVILRFVSFNNLKIYSHVYCIARKGAETYTLDAVERTKDGKAIFNYARPFKYNFDCKHKR